MNDPTTPLNIDHFQQNGNIKLQPIDADTNNDSTINLELQVKTVPTTTIVHETSVNTSKMPTIKIVKATTTTSTPTVITTEHVLATKQNKLDICSKPGINIDESDKSKDTESNGDKEDEEEEKFSLCRYPFGKGWFRQLTWFITWPIYLVFALTIPDCEKPKLKKWFPLTFMMCIIWIGSLSYFVAWMITIIGDTLKIPDSVMGITFLAAGTSKIIIKIYTHY